MLGADMALDIEPLLEKFPKSRRDTELTQLEFVVLRHVAELRSIYSLYSSLGQSRSSDNAFLLSRLQLWRLLKDCHIHHHDTTLVQTDRLVSDPLPSEEIHSPFSSMLPRQLLSTLVTIAHHIYQQDQRTSKDILATCFSRMMKDNILPNAKTVKGHLFRHQDHAVAAGKYMDRCWVIYQELSTASSALQTDRTVTCRDLVWMFKDLRLFDSNLTTRRLLEIINAEEPDAGRHCLGNLEREITFLEFFEVLLGCSEVSSQLAVGSSSEVIGRSPGEGARESLLFSQSLLTQSMGKSSDTQQSSISEDMEGLSVQPEVNIKSHTAESTPHLSYSELGDPSSLQGSFLETTATSCPPSLTSTGLAHEAKHEEFPHLSVITMWPHPQYLTFNRILPHSPAPVPPTDSCSEHQKKDEGEMLQVDSMEAQDSELDVWMQRCHHFFTRLFLTYDHERLLRHHMDQERLGQQAQRRIAIAKAQEQARLREQREAEEEQRKKEAEEEETVAERGDRNEDEVICSLSEEASSSSITVTPAAKQASRPRKRPPAKKAGKRA